WERKLKKGGARCKHRPPPKMTHQQDLTKSQNFFPVFLVSPPFMTAKNLVKLIFWFRFRW
ncbi:hypothetical protein EFQ56_09660, partial [Limosilactobacillus fermentum]|uniref:hypothetical protein n=1 Tax=Limosilactobacillus fermentum TaxID=1613 RepID=UPI0021A4688B